MSAQVQRLNNSSLLRRRNLGANRNNFEALRQFLVGQFVYVTAEKEIVGQDPDLTADFPGDDVVVAREDFNVHPRLRQCGDRSLRALLRRIEEGDVAEK